MFPTIFWSLCHPVSSFPCSSSSSSALLMSIRVMSPVVVNSLASSLSYDTAHSVCCFAWDPGWVMVSTCFHSVCVCVCAYLSLSAAWQWPQLFASPWRLKPVTTWVTWWWISVRRGRCCRALNFSQVCSSFILKAVHPLYADIMSCFQSKVGLVDLWQLFFDLF